MTCAATILTATASALSASSPLPAMSEPSPCAPAGNIETGPSSDGRTAIIASRCKRMTFRSNEVRKRYLAIHNLFASKTCSGDT